MFSARLQLNFQQSALRQLPQCFVRKPRLLGARRSSGDHKYPPVPTEAVLGDCWHRFYVRMLEVIQSIDLVRQGINKALQSPEDYKASDLIDFWVVGLSQGALDDFRVDFLDAFFDKLDEAIANGDTDAMYDILSWTIAYNISLRLAEEARAALQGASG